MLEIQTIIFRRKAMMIQNCTDEQALKMATLAVNNSIPMGMGHLHYEPKTYTTEDVKPYLNARKGKSEIYIDYFHGRMVKFQGENVGENKWAFDDNINVDYQSWAAKFDSYQALFDAINNPKTNFEHVSEIKRQYTNAKCLLKDELIMLLVLKEDPCKGCNMDRNECGGRPKS
jgi:hypothetical protein